MLEYENKEIDIDDFLDEGYILIRAIIELMGSPKEFVNELLKDLRDKLFLFQVEKFPNVNQEEEKKLREKIEKIVKENKDLLEGSEERKAAIVNLFIDDVKEVLNSPMFSAYVEVEILIKDIKSLFLFSTLFTPTSLQIIEPTKIKVDNITLQDFLNETISLLNNLFNNMKNLDAENKMLREELSNCKKLAMRFKK
ncbi:MAG: hypothetical protein ABGW69_02795 [Nanoarchaeota archaeon]